MRILAIGAAACLLLVTSAPLAEAQSADRTVRIATGLQNQTYHKVYGARLARFLRAYDVKFELTEGSVENVQLIAAGEVEIAFAQADVYSSRVRQDPDRYAGVSVLGRLADECLYVAYRKNGPVGKLADLTGPVEGRAPRVALGSSEGGAAETWSHLVDLQPGLRAAETQTVGGTLAINRLDGGALDAVVWVTDPGNLDHPMLRAVYEGSNLGLMEVTDPTLEFSLPSGPRIYGIETIHTKDGWLGTGLFANRIQTLCTAALVLARKDANPRVLEDVSNAIGLHRDELIGR